MKKTCKKRGGTLKEACKAIFEAGCGGWCCYECECGLWHIVSMPVKI